MRTPAMPASIDFLAGYSQADPDPIAVTYEKTTRHRLPPRDSRASRAGPGHRNSTTAREKKTRRSAPPARPASVPGLKYQSQPAAQSAKNTLPSAELILRAMSASELVRLQDDFQPALNGYDPRTRTLLQLEISTCQRTSDKSR